MKKRIPKNMLGPMTRVCARDAKEYESIYMSSDCAVAKDFRKTYEDYMSKMEIVAGCAKVYILKNWEKIADWRNLHVVIEDNTEKPTEYYNFKPHKRRSINGKPIGSENFSIRMDKINNKRHNPITTINNVVLDWDGDFSVDINGKEHFWISNESVIVIANYIEEQLLAVK